MTLKYIALHYIALRKCVTDIFNTIVSLIVILSLVLYPGFIFSEGASENAPENSSGFFSSVNKFDGSVNYSLPIVIPPGRNGLDPKLQLSYNSQGGRATDHLGYGWSINVPYIQRINKTGVQDMYGQDYFYSTIDGELVSEDDTNFVPRVETGSNHQYVFSSSTWTVTDKFGKTYIFGSSTNSRLDNPSDSNEIYKWMLVKETDSNGNVINYAYYKDRGDIYIDQISYNQEGYFTVDFNRTSRTVATSSYTGFPVLSRYEVNNIQVNIDGALINEYDITKSGNRVTEILRTGHDSTNSIELPPVEITYVDEQLSKTFAYDSSWDSSVNDEFSPGTRLVDINGDGLDDAVTSYFNTSWGPDHQRSISINTGSGWSGNGGFTIPEDDDFIFYNEDSGEIGSAQLADINADGLADFVIFEDGGGGSATMKVYTNTGSSWSYDSTWDKSTYSDFALGTRFADVNGDGLSDILVSYFDTSWGPDHQRSVTLNTGQGWGSSGGWTIDEDEDLAFWHEDDGGPGHGQLGDLNGDGLVDLIKFVSGSPDKFRALINSGSDWELDPAWDQNQSSEFAPGARFVDLNADRFTDYVMTWVNDGNFQRTSVLNTGSGWGTGFTIPNDETYAIWDDEYNKPGPGHLADINGDGLTDFVIMGLDNELRAHFNIFAPSLLASSITNSYGGITNFEYTTPGIQSNTNKARVPLNVAASVVTNDLNGIYSTTTYEYSNADFWYGSTTDRAFAGFATVSTTDSYGNQKAFKFHQANGETANEQTDVNFALVGRLYEESVYDNSDALYNKKRIKYSVSGTSTGTSTILVNTVLTREYDGFSTPRDSAVGYSYDTNGNLTSKTEYGEVSGSANGDFSDSGTDDRETVYTYASPLVGLVATETLFDTNASKVKESRYYYDTSSLGTATVGNLTKQEDWVNASNYVDTEWTYNSFGLPTSKTDPRNNVASFSYDAKNLYIATTTNPESHVTTYQYDYSLGKPATTTNPNGSKNVTVYDSVDRAIIEKAPDSETGSLVTKTSYVYTDSPGAISVKQTNHLNSTVENDIYRYLDGFGRVAQERTESEDGQYAVQDFSYEVNHNIRKESLPYFSSGTGRTAATSSSDLYTDYSYDPMNRVTESANAVGTTYTVYDRGTNTVTDPLENYKDYNYDVFGRLVGVTEYNSTSSYDTSYDWDDRNNLTTITDALGNDRGITYDGLSRRLTLEDLHGSGDGTYGTWQYAYDKAGNLASTTDPKGQIVAYTYDGLNRTLTEDYLGQSGTDVNYEYDSCTEGVGYLCQVINTSATTTFTYTYDGQPATETKEVGGSTYTTEYEYDRLDNKTLIIYPDDSEVKYTYNNANKIEKIEQKENGGTFVDVVSDLDYGPHDLITYQKFGNGASTTKVYDEGELYRLRTIITSTSDQIGSGGSELAEIEANLVLDEFGELVYAEHMEMDGTGEETAEAIEPESVLVEEDVSVTTEETSQLEEVSIEETPVVEGSGVALATTAEQETVEPTSVEPAITSDDVVTLGEESVTTTTTEEVLPVVEALSTTTEASSTPEFLAKKLESEALISLLKEKDSTARADYKADLVKDAAQTGRFGKDDYLIDVLAIDKIEGGVQVFAKAWKDDKQLGFGKDGTVEIERFEIFNPPLMVPDENGEVVIEYVTRSGDKRTRSLRVDPEEALREVVAQNIALAGTESDSINYGSVGSTTSTFYPSVDGYIEAYAASGNTTFDNLRNGTSVSFYEDDTTTGDWIGELTSSNTSNKWYHMARGFFLFDTSSLPDTDNIATATLSLYGIYKNNGLGDVDVKVFSSNPASSTALAATASDYNSIGSTAYSSAISYSNWQTSAYNDIILNATGKGAVTATGTTKLSTRANYDYNNAAPTWVRGATSRLDSYFAEVAGTTQDPKLVVQHFAAPTAPGSLLLEGQTSPATSSDATPEFSAIFNHTATSALAISYQIHVSTSSSFGTNYWDSGTTALPYTVSVGQRSPDISYSGATLAPTTTYYWRIKFWDNNGLASPWSTTTNSFIVTASSSEPWIQHIEYTYDTVGNITQIADTSGTQNAVTTLYTYDDLYRLLTASTTVAATSPYRHTFTYSALGNLTTKSDVGSYTYNDDGYNNPHAADAIGGVSLSYDQNGNLTSYASSTYGWDYMNRLASSSDGVVDTAYGYDHENQRVLKTSGTTTTVYPNKYFEVQGATTTKHIYAGDELVAYVETDGVASSTYYIHADHLGSTNVVTDESGEVQSTKNYYPFGSSRTDSGDASLSRGYIGQSEDGDDISYLNARYYKSDRGQFLSQDPVFWEIGQTRDGKAVLRNPQLQNSYSYAGNNPIINKDPDGRCPVCLVALAFYGGYTAGTDLYEGYTNGDNGRFALGVVGAVSSLVPAGGALSLADDAAKYSVYLGRDSEGVLRYVGMTGRGVGVRIVEHLKSNTARSYLEYDLLSNDLTKSQARVLEQLFINQNGLSRNGGTLLNKINSISPTSALYQSVQVAGKSSAVQAAVKYVSGSSSATHTLLNKAAKELKRRLE